MVEEPRPLRLTLPTVTTVSRFFRRLIRAVRIAARDKRIPKPLRWLAAVGLLPIPGPFDEAVLLIVAIPLGLFYRGPLKEAWQRAQNGKRLKLKARSRPEPQAARLSVRPANASRDSLKEHEPPAPLCERLPSSPAGHRQALPSPDDP